MQNALFHTAHAVSEILASQGKLSVFVIVDCISLSLRYTVLLFEIKLKKKKEKRKKAPLFFFTVSKEKPLSSYILENDKYVYE